MNDWDGDERRYLDPAHPARVEWCMTCNHHVVRTGPTHKHATTRAHAESMAYVHNYMHGHLLNPAGNLPAPTDRRHTIR